MDDFELHTEGAASCGSPGWLVALHGCSQVLDLVLSARLAADVLPYQCGTFICKPALLVQLLLLHADSTGILCAQAPLVDGP